MSDQAHDFGVRLSLAMKLLNISRGALASEARTDKSLVSRWARGMTMPRGHSLSILTQIVRGRVPVFSQLTWGLPLDDFAKVLGGPSDAVPLAVSSAPPTARHAGLSGEVQGAEPPDREIYMTGTQQSRIQSKIEVEREGHTYPGVYAGFRLAFRNAGEIVPDLIVLWCKDRRLFFQTFDPSFSHTGEVFILRHQLFVLAEDDKRVDGLAYYVLNGVSGHAALRIDGIMMSVAADRHRTPTAAPVVWLRIADLLDESEPPADEVLSAIAGRMNQSYSEGRLGDVIGPVVEAAIRPRVGTPDLEGATDSLLRIPMTRSLVASEVESSDALEQDLARVRAAFIAAPIVPSASPGTRHRRSAP